MNENLKQTLKLLPSLPGCYIYYNKEGEVIYVGKAKILKRRVSSYFNRKHDSVKVNVLVSQIERLEYIITNTEVEAIILESHLIKKYKPKYNKISQKCNLISIRLYFITKVQKKSPL